MAVSISPTGLATTALVADQVSILATYTENLCNIYCVNSSIVPQYAITYINEAPVLVGSTTFVPIVATITITTAKCKCDARTRIYTERFMVAFQGQTTLPASVTITSVGRTTGATNVRCCVASAFKIEDSLTIAIA